MAKRKKIPQSVKLKLFADSQGHCQRPDCLTQLFPREMGGEQHIAEMAHVIPYAMKGPRHEQRQEQNDNPDTFENLILLCPTCHTIIDKDAASFPRSTLIEWKEQHKTTLSASLGIRAFDSRDEVRARILPIMDENKAIWRLYAPIHGSEFNFDPESDAAAHWEHRMRSVMLPNHYRIQSIIGLNLKWATEKERATFAEFKEHVRSLTERHVCNVAGRAIRFPTEMEFIFS